MNLSLREIYLIYSLYIHYRFSGMDMYEPELKRHLSHIFSIYNHRFMVWICMNLSLRGIYHIYSHYINYRFSGMDMYEPELKRDLSHIFSLYKL